MYTENKYKINWIKIFVKSIVFVIIVLFVIWFGSNIILRLNSYERIVFNNNIMNMKSASLEYFNMESLPGNGEVKRITLGEILDQKLMLSPIDTKGNSCDRNDSYVEITNLDSYYSLRITLSCGNNIDSVYTKIKK